MSGRLRIGGHGGSTTPRAVDLAAERIATAARRAPTERDAPPLSAFLMTPAARAAKALDRAKRRKKGGA